MRKKLLILAVISILLIAIPLVIATVTNSQTINVNGTARYPNLPPTPDPTATPSATPVSTSFSLYFANGTSYPSTISNANWFYVTVNNPDAGVGAQPNPNEILVQNDGNVPINITASDINVNLPSDMSLSLFYGDGSMQPLTVAVGQSSLLYIVVELSPIAYDYTPQQSFSYSFGISVTATQA